MFELRLAFKSRINTALHDFDSEGEIGDAYDFNVTVDFATIEADCTEVEKEFVDALAEIEGQKAFHAHNVTRFVNQRVD